jgi:hypothetical protein
MIRNDARPDDRDFSEYFRILRNQRSDLKSFFFLNTLNRSLSSSQDHICPLCGETLYNGEGIHIISSLLKKVALLHSPTLYPLAFA